MPIQSCGQSVSARRGKLYTENSKWEWSRCLIIFENFGTRPVQAFFGGRCEQTIARSTARVMVEASVPRVQRRTAARVRGMRVKMGSKYDCTFDYLRMLWVWRYSPLDVRVLSCLCLARRRTPPLSQLQREPRTIHARWVRT